MQLESDWDRRFRDRDTPWEDDDIAPATKQLIPQNVSPGKSILEVGCGLGVNAVWLAGAGYRVAACDISAKAVSRARQRAKEDDVEVDFAVADVLVDGSKLPRCDAVLERGVLHTFVTAEGRARLAAAIAELLEPGELWLSISGCAATPAEAEAAARTRCARVSLSQIAEAVERWFDIVSVTRVTYGLSHLKTGFAAYACVFRRPAPEAGQELC
jgi:SAM-dependent methyltransferase